MRRDGNKTAHKLAKLAVSHSGHHVWVDVWSKEIWSIVCTNFGS